MHRNSLFIDSFPGMCPNLSGRATPAWSTRMQHIARRDRSKKELAYWDIPAGRSGLFPFSIFLFLDWLASKLMRSFDRAWLGLPEAYSRTSMHLSLSARKSWRTTILLPPKPCSHMLRYSLTYRASFPLPPCVVQCRLFRVLQ